MKRIEIFTTHYVINIAQTLSIIIQELGYDVCIHNRNITNEDIDRCNENKSFMFILCIQWLYGRHLKPLPKSRYYVYQMEQFDKKESDHIHNEYVYDLLRNAKHVFEYSHLNMLYYNTMNIDKTNVSHLIPPCVLWEPKMTHNKPIDVLFCGSINNRRLNILNQISNSELNVHVESKLFGSDLQDKISQSKIFLNIRFSNSTILETCRIHEALMCKHIYIISEMPDIHSNDIEVYKKRVNFVEYNNISGLISKIRIILNIYNMKKPDTFNPSKINDVVKMSLKPYI